jgi:hypothetical protein
VLPFIFALELVIQNQGSQLLELSEAGMALELPDGNQYRPLPIVAVAREVAARYAVAPQEKETPPEVLKPEEAVGVTLLGVGMLLIDQRTQAHAAAEQATGYRRKALQEVVLAQDDAATGFLFFSSPVARGFREAVLRLQFVETTSTSAVIIRLPLQRLKGGPVP